jgi:hypothetical protein
MSRLKQNDLLHAAHRVADALGIDRDAVVDLAVELEKDDRAGWSSGDLLLLALGKLVEECAAAEAETLPPGDTDYPWIAEVHRDRDGRLCAQGAALSWLDALRNVLGALPSGDEPWTLTLRGPQGAEARVKQRSAEARFKSRAGVEAAMRAQRWAGVMDAVQQEWATRVDFLGVLPGLDAVFADEVLDLVKVRQFAISAGIPESEFEQAVAEGVSLRHYIVYRTTGADHVEAMLQAAEGIEP